MDEVGFLEVNSMDGDVVVDQDLFYQELDPFSEVSFDFQAVDFNANEDIQSSQDLLYHENFDTYNNGDAITAVSQAFELWPGGDATDAFVTNETQFSGANSLKIEGSAGPVAPWMWFSKPGSRAPMTFRSTYSCHLVRQDITTSKKHHFRS